MAAIAFRSGSRILLVDDDPVIRSLLRKILEVSKVARDVHDAVDASSAMRLMGDNAFDCVVLDHLLPDMSGLDFLKAVRAKDARTPVIMLTGMGDEMLAVAAMKAGATDYMSKVGFSKERFLEAVRRAVETPKAAPHA